MQGSVSGEMPISVRAAITVFSTEFVIAFLGSAVCNRAIAIPRPPCRSLPTPYNRHAEFTNQLGGSKSLLNVDDMDCAAPDEALSICGLSEEFASGRARGPSTIAAVDVNTTKKEKRAADLVNQRLFAILSGVSRMRRNSFPSLIGWRPLRRVPVQVIAFQNR